MCNGLGYTLKTFLEMKNRGFLLNAGRVSMTPRLSRRLAIILAGLALTLGWPPLSWAQTTLPESTFTPSHEAPVISRQLRLAQQLGRKALAGLEATSANDATPIDPAVIQAARDTYGLIRAGRHGMMLSQSGKKIADPLFDLNFKKVTQAWDLSRIPVDKYSWGIPRSDYLKQSIPALRESMRLLDQVLIVMP